MNIVFHRYPVDKFDIMSGDLIELEEGLFMWVTPSNINSLGYSGNKLDGKVIINIKPLLKKANNLREAKRRMIDRVLDNYLDEVDSERKFLLKEMVSYSIKHYLS